MLVRTLEVEETPLKDAFIIKPLEFTDERGVFYKLFNEEILKEVGFTQNFPEQYISISKKGVLRGLHYQSGGFSQGKLIQCIKGEVHDVILDLRKKSATFGQWAGITLSQKNMHTIAIPRGFAHGFAVQSNEAVMLYHVDNHYSAAHERGVRWNDPSLGIDWKINKPILNEKDATFPLFKDAEYF